MSEHQLQITRVIDAQFKLVDLTFDELSASLQQQAAEAQRSLWLVSAVLAARRSASKGQG